MKVRKSVTTRIISAVLCLVMVLSCVPVWTLNTTAATVTTGGQTVDPHTLDQWMEYFGVQTDDPNNVSLSTEFAGAVWTDKSVFDPGNIPSQLTGATYNGNSISISDDGDNFLVALSAIASNKQIVGYSTIPTDTVIVLDLSSSMRYADDDGGSAVDELVQATNKAITELLKLNKNNRVAVVVYAGNVNKSFSEADGITQVVLPLDSYSTTEAGTYLTSEAVGSSADRAIEVYSGVKDSSGAAVSENRFEVSTGTYMQDGIYEAMKLFLDADPVVQSGVQAGTTRLPIMVLMSDGEPTLASSDYNGNDARTELGTTDLSTYDGSTGTYTFRDTIAFMTSLTAAFAKKTVETHYNTDALMYTLPYGNAVLSRDEALSVLNPAEASNVQNSLWNSFLDGNEVTVFRTGSRREYTYTTVKNSDVESEKLTAEDRLYVDKYFPAEDDDAMLNAFDAIVAEIVIQSKYYPTYVEKDYDHDGYLTFVDKIGEYMEVTDVEGIVVGDRLFSGAALAAEFVDGSLGSMEEPTSTGNELIRSIMTRLNISNSETAKALAVSAYSHGQLSYTDDQNFSHYLGWFSDAEGNYLDFWHEGMTDTQIEEAVSKKGATHIIKSYIFLGDTTVVPGVNNTDMMYMSVRVAEEIATGSTIVTWRVPASLVPTITYEVDVEVDSEGKIQGVSSLGLEDGTADSPIRLLYEVGLRSNITDWNIAEKVSDSYVSANGYTFYSNKWSSDANDTTLNTYSHFEPSVQNERYYYTQDTAVLVKNGDSYTAYTGTKPSGSGYYHGLQVFEKLENGTLRIHEHYEPISSEAMASVKADGSGWVIPKDTVHRYYDYEITAKEQNNTATMAYSDHPFVVKSGSVYYTYSTQGNNGKITVTPATGIKLTKQLEEGFESNAEFTFVIGGSIAGAQVVRLNGDGTEKSRTALAANGEVKLVAGETVYILGLAAGSYTVSEQIAAGADYHVKTVTVNGTAANGTTAQVTLAAQDIFDVVFTNAEQGYGSLVVSKDVNYPEGFMPTDSHDAKTFTVVVTFTGDTTGMTAPAGAVQNGNAYTLTLKDGDSLTFANIPEGVTYTVTETGLTDGYTNTAIRFSNENKTITSAVTDEAHVVNAYTPAATSVNLKVRGTKTVTGGWPANASFTLRLWEVTDFSSGTVIDTKLTDTVAEGDASYEIDMSSITFDREGTYYFRVIEDIPADRVPDMAYDRTYGLFSVTVTDTDADGKLEVSAVQAYQNTQLTGSAQDGYVITKDFVNVVTKDIVYLNVQKTVMDAAGKAYTDHLADITFGLFDSMNSQTPTYYILTDGEGKGTIAVPVTQDSLGAEGKVYYLREIAPAVENRVVGMNYDESWIYAVRITWDETDHVAVTEYAPIENGTVGTYAALDDTVEFTHTNTYEPNVYSTPEIELSGVKTLNGGNDLGGRSFSFSLYETTAAFVIQGSALQTVTNNGNAITFDGIAFTTPGMHYLTVKEDATSLGGVTVDSIQYHITVLVEKYAASDGTTRLRVAEGYPHIVPYGATDSVAADGLNFNNIYTISGETEATISGTKTLTGRPMLNGEFTFRLTEVADEIGTAKTDALVLETENGPANGSASFIFEPITYTKAGTHYYKITEVAGPSGNGVTYSTDSFIVKVVVSDNGKGGLQASQSVVGGRTVAFANSYKPSGTYTDFYAGKELSGKVLADGQFEFILTETQQDFKTAVEGGLNKTVKNDSYGVIAFGRITYTQEGVHYYRIRENVPAKVQDGVTYDETEYHVTVRVVDNQKGSLEKFASIVMVTEDEDGNPVSIPTSSIVFYNHYNITGTAGIQINGTKVMSGRDLNDGDFTFELYKTGETYTIDGVVPQTTTNEGEAFSFVLNYEPEDAGQTYYYLLQEKNRGETIDGVTYSDAEYRIQVSVQDDDKGGLKLEVVADGLVVTVDGNATVINGAEFTNKYAVANEDLVLTVKKTVTGHSTDPSGFEFGLYEGNSETPLRTVTSDADGVVSFEKLTATVNHVRQEPYVFYVKEILPEGTVNGVKDGWTYDTTVYKVELTVSEDGKGNLIISYTVDGADVDEETYQFAFTNSYKKPTVTPSTGDESQLGLWFVMMILSAGAVVTLMVYDKKRKQA